MAIPPHQQLHLKPGRSEFFHVPFTPALSLDPVPEICKFQSLSALSEPLICDFSGGDPLDEYVETDYYKVFNSVDRSVHHTIGTGFIQIEGNNVDDFNLGLVSTTTQCYPTPNMVFPKPARSDC